MCAIPGEDWACSKEGLPSAPNPPSSGRRRLVKLDVTALANAVQRLCEGLARCTHEPADEQLRDGLIQRYEFTYELSIY